jgi:hypothetical protein
MTHPSPIVVGHGAEQMKFICYAQLSLSRRVKAGASLAGPAPREICAKAVFFHPEGGYYLFSCDDEWRVMFDTWHESIADAQHQAEYEHPGISKDWVFIEAT